MHAVLISSPGKGHYFPLVQLARALSTQINVTVVWPLSTKLPSPPVTEHDQSETLDIRIMDIDAEPHLTTLWLFDNPEIYFNNLTSIIQAQQPKFGYPNVCIIDMFSWEIEKLKSKVFVFPNQSKPIPVWIFCPSPLTFMYLMYSGIIDREKLEDTLLIPGLDTTFLKTDIPKFPEKWGNLIERAVASHHFSDGILVNDCRSWYPETFLKAIDHIPRPLPGPESLTWPKVAVGPLTEFDRRADDLGVEDREMISWLDNKPAASVVYVALGSWLCLPKADLIELARGLQDSGMYVLWSHRVQLETTRALLNPGERPTELEPTDPDTDLPCGFIEETKDRIKIVQWANQIKILTHPSVGMFLSHCGWNSTIECLGTAGKPFACLPLGADQLITARFLQDILGVGIMLWEGLEVEALDRRKIVEKLMIISNDKDYAEKATSVLKDISGRGHDSLKVWINDNVHHPENS